MLDNQKKLVEYLEGRGAQFSGEKIGHAGMLAFSLKNEAKENGRLMMRKDGSASIWHLSAPRGLSLATPFEAETERQIGNRKIASFYIAPNDVSKLTQTNELLKRSEKQPEVKVQHTYDQQAFKASVMRELESYGWQYKYERGGIQYWNDGNGSTAAERVKIADGIASVWSFKNDVDFPSPWRAGRETSMGNKSVFITAKDLELKPIGFAPVKRMEEIKAPQEINEETVAFVRSSWESGTIPSVDHPQLIKEGAKLSPDNLRQFPNNKTTWEKYMTKDLLAPVFRDDKKGGLELSGGQRLMHTKYENNDKLLLEGTQIVGAFMPIPVDPLMNGKPDIENWINSLGESVKDKPLVIAEGVGSSLAIHQSKAGNVIAGITSNNLVNVARWVKESGLADRFPKGVVIASELDIKRDESGRLKSNAIPKAIEAAKIVGGKVALPEIGSKVGTDARDLLGGHGDKKVVDYINNAVEPDLIKERRDFMPKIEKQSEKKFEILER